jgi:hypothetical protein
MIYSSYFISGLTYGHSFPIFHRGEAYFDAQSLWIWSAFMLFNKKGLRAKAGSVILACDAQPI